MKTPKRNKGNGYEADCFPYAGPNQTAFEHARQTRRLVEKVDKLMEEVREVDAHYKAFKKAHEGSPTCMTCFWFCYTRDGAQCATGVVDKPSPAQTACQYYRINKFP